MLGFVSFSTAQAGELSVTGKAKASYVILSSDSAAAAVEDGKGFGVSNEFTLGANGELDNGYTWKYFINERNYPWLCAVNIPTNLKSKRWGQDTYLHLTAETGQIDAFKAALGEEVDINVKNNFGETIFHLACMYSRYNIVEFLLKNSNLNIDTNAKDNAGSTGFSLACQRSWTFQNQMLI